MKAQLLISLIYKIRTYNIKVSNECIKKLMLSDVEVLASLNNVNIEQLDIALKLFMKSRIKEDEIFKINCLKGNCFYLNKIEELINDKNVNLKGKFYLKSAIQTVNCSSCEFVADIVTKILENPMFIYNLDEEDLGLYFAKFLVYYDNLNIIDYQVLSYIINDKYFNKTGLNKILIKSIDTYDIDDLYDYQNIFIKYFKDYNNFKEFFQYIFFLNFNDNIEKREYLLMIINIFAKNIKGINKDELSIYIYNIFTANKIININNLKINNNINNFFKRIILIYYLKDLYSNDKEKQDALYNELEKILNSNLNIKLTKVRNLAKKAAI